MCEQDEGQHEGVACWGRGTDRMANATFLRAPNTLRARSCSPSADPSTFVAVHPEIIKREETTTHTGLVVADLPLHKARETLAAGENVALAGNNRLSPFLGGAAGGSLRRARAIVIILLQLVNPTSASLWMGWGWPAPYALVAGFIHGLVSVVLGLFLFIFVSVLVRLGLAGTFLVVVAGTLGGRASHDRVQDGLANGSGQLRGPDRSRLSLGHGWSVWGVC